MRNYYEQRIEARLPMNTPSFTVIITNHNYENVVWRAIDSALNQEYANFEVIVVDDGSTDRSREVIDRYSGRVTAVYCANGGQANGFNEGLKRSQGDVICFLDADDVFAKNKLDRLSRVFLDGRVDWCFHDFVKVVEERGLNDGFCTPGKQGFCDFRLRTKLGVPPALTSVTSSMAFRRSFIERFAPIPSDSREPTAIADNYLRAVALGYGCGYRLNGVLAEMRFHGSNWSSRRVRVDVAANKGVLTAWALLNKAPEMWVLAARNCGRSISLVGGSQGLDPRFRGQFDECWQNLGLTGRHLALLLAYCYGGTSWLGKLIDRRGNGAGRR